MKFDMPTARHAMIAIQARVLAGGNEWNLFDRFQAALYVDILDISDEEVIADIIVEADIDLANFLTYYADPHTEAMVTTDFKLADDYELEMIPAMVVEGKHIIEDTKRSDLALKLLQEAAEAEGITLLEK